MFLKGFKFRPELRAELNAKIEKAIISNKTQKKNIKD